MDKNEIIELIAKRVETKVEITEESRLFDDLGLSSLKMFALLCEFEEKIGKQLSIMDFVGVKTVKDLTDKIISK